MKALTSILLIAALLVGCAVQSPESRVQSPEPLEAMSSAEAAVIAPAVVTNTFYWKVWVTTNHEDPNEWTNYWVLTGGLQAADPAALWEPCAAVLVWRSNGVPEIKTETTNASRLFRFQFQTI